MLYRQACTQLQSQAECYAFANTRASSTPTRTEHGLSLRPLEWMGQRGTKQTGPPANISNQIHSVWFLQLNDSQQYGYKAYGAQYKKPSAKPALNLTCR